MIIFLGLAGSGKSTQSQLLAQRLKCPWLSTGQLLRDTVKDKKIRERMLAGEILDDSLMLSLLDQQLKKLGSEEFILDGSPRTMRQAIWLVDKIERHEIDLTAVIHLKASEMVVKKRLLRKNHFANTQLLPG
jgi:adenylate kinase